MKLLSLLLFMINIVYAQDTSWRKNIDEWVKNNRKETTQNFKIYHWGTRGVEDWGTAAGGITIPKKPGVLRPNVDECLSAKRPDAKGNKSEDSPLELTSPEAIKYFKQMTASFYKREDSGWLLGSGLYAALNPLQSISYAGNKKFFLMELSFNRPVYYVDFDSKDYMEKTDHKWRKQFALALKANDIAFIRYPYVPAYIYLCGDNQREAFNVIRPELLEEGVSVKVFVKEMSPIRLELNEYQKLGEKFNFIFQKTNLGTEHFFLEELPVKKWIDLLTLVQTKEYKYNTRLFKEETFGCLDTYELDGVL